MNKTFIRLCMTALLALALAPITTWGQTDPCPWFRNTAAFGSAGSGLSFKGWSARVGERVSTSSTSDTTTGYYIMSTCADPNCQNIIGHANITSTSLNSGEDGGITWCNYGNIWDANDRRFQIITSTNAGIDEFTINGANTGMQRIPAGYQTSIRLGDPRAPSRQTGPTSHTWNANSPLGNKGAEALFYTLNVTPQNALLFINYAVVGRCFDHSTYQAGEFLIRVVKRNSDGTWATTPINDSMWFKISAPPIPSSGVPNAPWVMGKPGAAGNGTTCAYVYKPWTKVAISLNEFLYDWVRIEMYTSDCIYNYDPIYAYICGDYQAMMLTPYGCPDPESSVVDTLIAPDGMLSYAWYVSTHGPVPDNQTLNARYMDTIEFRQVWPPNGGSDLNRNYAAQLEDFVLSAGPNAGDTVAKQTFMCVMTSALDPNKPFESRIYTNLSNRKPIAASGYEQHCDTSITFIDGSIAYAVEGLADDSTHWIIYSDTLGQNPLDTIPGNIVNYKFPNIGKYSVRHYVTTGGDPCTAAEFFVCEAIGNPPSGFTMSTRQLCESDLLAVHVSDSVRALEGATLRWAIDSVAQPATTPDAQLSVPLGSHLVSLTVTLPTGCTSTTYDSVTVYGQPSIDLSSTVNAICLGDSVTLSAAGSISYYWNSLPYDSTIANVQGQTSFTVHPTVNTTYFLLPSEDNPCSVEGAQVNIEVLPYPIPTIRTSSPRVNMENSTLICQDISPNSTTSHWSFSDGLTAEGARVSHSFANTSADSVSITLQACNRLDCCADTTIYLPVELTVVWFPNTITPNQSSNNLFGVHTLVTLHSYELYVYNRQGMLVYYSDDPANKWDGTLENGADAPQGTYTWFCRYSYSPATPRTAYGTVTILR